MKLLILIMLAAPVFAHSNLLYNIDLSFDPTMAQTITKAAQTYLKTAETPNQYDYDNELIAVKFDKSVDYYALVYPVDNSIFGFRDDTLVTTGSSEKISKEQRKEIANKIFENTPQTYKEQLRYGEESRTYLGTYITRYYRYVNEIYVSGDHLEIEIDATDGDVIGWRLSPFLTPSQKMTTNPAISGSVAEQIALKTYNAEKVSFEPQLIIIGEKPHWIVQIKMFYPLYVAVNALDGSILYFGPLRTTMPKDYSVGKEIPIVPNKFIQQLENSQ